MPVNIDVFLDFIRGLGPWAYAIVFLLVTAQASLVVGFLLPGEIATVFAGFLAAEGVLRVAVLLPVVCTAAILGNFVGFALGWWLRGVWILRHGGRFGLRAERVERVEAFFRRHGGMAVLLGRFSPPLRAGVPFVAGASQVSLRTFAFYTVVGGMLWGTGAVLLGYLAGSSWRTVERWAGRADLIVLAVAALAAVLAYRWRRGRQ
jgi:undecaprenyl-diphosphatase